MFKCVVRPPNHTFKRVRELASCVALTLDKVSWVQVGKKILFHADNFT